MHCQEIDRRIDREADHELDREIDCEIDCSRVRPEHACAAVPEHRRADCHTPHATPGWQGPGGHQSSVKFTAMLWLDWSIAVQAEPFT
ncbi:hypothetical protein K377_02324 [Streptomyces sp. PsTaAH-137]|nr:hypothetical protein K377_02324 [Streptomyces sp. PsTaAH-137]